MRPCFSAVFLLAATTLYAQREARLNRPGNDPSGKQEAVFLTHRLGNDHAEGVTMLDMNGDGFIDLVSGAYWYENPGANGGDWRRHQWRTVGYHDEFVSDCGEWTIDVNHDGAPDVVTTGWITNGVWWYENPRKPGVMWQKHLIADSYDSEGGAFADINGDGKPDLAIAHYNHSGALWIDFAGAKPRVHHLLPKEADGHGIGIVDIDGDGKADIVTPTGWFRNMDADNDKWEWHHDWELGETGFPIIGYDVNGDGRMDLIFGQGHSYGLYWLEQTGDRAHPKFVRHVIDESFSQSHALLLADIDGDGQPELITGKRYRAHSGGDPGAYDPIVLYYYKIDRTNGTFTRSTISMNGTAGGGVQILAADLDHDGDIDLVTSGKSGVHFMENLKVSHVAKSTREEQQVVERKWPFEGEGEYVEQENGPAATSKK